MKPLWTPWRMEYVSGRTGREPGCLFERGAGKKHDRRHLLLYRDPAATVFLNRFPYANGHLLLAPARHVGDVADLTDEEMLHLMRLIKESVTILRRQLAPEGFNIGLNLGKAAGAGVEAHLHYHIVPRWEGDHNFIAVLGELKAIPEHFLLTFDRLLPSFQDLFHTP